MKTRIEVSPEMVAFVGMDAVSPFDWPLNAYAMAYDLAAGTVAIDPAPSSCDALADADVVLVVAASACRRIFDLSLDVAGTWHLPSAVRSIALAIRDCAMPAAACETLRLAKSIELFCATFAGLDEGALVPVGGTRALSASDASRIVAAQRMIDERWHEKLTLEAIARACGINRGKLTRGFRAMFDRSIADAIADRRLGGARVMLLSTNLPVASVGYACGYLNNASFTRAFSRRFGVAPTRLRAAA
ncbi:helix-turn-helix transcriptional regulator [Sphingomonas sp. RS2018]